MEQQGIPLPLKEWALLDSNLRPTVMVSKSKSTVYTAITSTWDMFQQTLSPVHSPLVSVIYYSEFREAANNYDS